MEATLHYLKLVNWILIFGLIGIALAPLFLPRRQRSVEPVIKRTVFLPLLVGFILWALAYGLDLFMKADPLLVKRLVTSIDLIVVTAFVSCGSALLRLQQRIHPSLPSPSPRGFDHKWFVALPARLCSSRLTFLVFLVIGAGILIPLLLTSGTPWHLDAHDAVFSFFGMSVLGLGFLRELNRWRADLTSVMTAGALLLYAASQLLVYFESIQIPVYTFGLLSKGIMFMGIASFFELSREARLAFRSAYRQAHEEFSDSILRLLAHHRSARHSIYNATSKQGFIIRELQRLTPGELHPHLDKIVAQAKEIEQQAQTLLSLSEADELFEHRPVQEFLESVRQELDGIYSCRICCETDGDADFEVPNEVLREALHRIIENAAKAGAAQVVLSARSEPDQNVITIANNGPPIPSAGRQKLFNTRRGGFWVARRIAINLGGTISLQSSDSQGTRFEIILPRSEADD